MGRETVKAGIIGFGYMGNFHLNKMRSIKGIEAYAVYDIDKQKLEDAKSENLQVYENLDEMLQNEDIDLIVICTPNQVHAELSMKALEAGKHVLCEKPATMTVKELQDVLNCAVRSNRIYTTHQNRRWDADYRVVKQVIDNRTIGQVTTIISQTFGQRGVCFGWRADAEKGGGMLYDWGIHLVDQMLLLFEGKKVISVYARLRSILTPVVDDYFEAELEFEGDIVAHLAVATFALQELPRWYIFADRGTLKLDDFSGEKGGIAKIKDNIRGFERVKADQHLGPSRTMAHLEREELEELELPCVKDTLYEFYENLIDSIQGRAKPVVTPEQMLRAMRVIEAIFESNRVKGRLEVKI